MPTSAPSPVPPLLRRSTNISAALAAHFERLIATGELAPGARLPGERELSTSMAVSRASLREAMHELEQKHLIERTPGRGTVVTEPSAQAQALRQLAVPAVEQDDAAELRVLVEPSIAALAARRATDADLLQLARVLDASSEDLRPSQSVELDVEFHALLSRAARNPLLAALHELVSDWTLPVRQVSHRRRTGRRDSVAGHRAIYDAVAAHDADAARAAMEDHLGDVRALVADQDQR
ncbi:FadR/GntR family transcriptional regulator [Quadrisphaera sp. INWT6]|uniref:FadR/GntR family transcriptional regulator n=1 Tax=Quadrisphaera sp. INWT6 TaxID=2596917 RepID=UPI0018922B84|nr:FCD domain-containing protein [Quadrisphaera sp. INWT6]MBF5082624.1 FadR family transcriptional regulator [Quadrisphaera sp. INWT6]